MRSSAADVGKPAFPFFAPQCSILAYPPAQRPALRSEKRAPPLEWTPAAAKAALACFCPPCLLDTGGSPGNPCMLTAAESEALAAQKAPRPRCCRSLHSRRLRFARNPPADPSRPQRRARGLSSRPGVESPCRLFGLAQPKMDTKPLLGPARSRRWQKKPRLYREEMSSVWESSDLLALRANRLIVEKPI